MIDNENLDFLTIENSEQIKNKINGIIENIINFKTRSKVIETSSFEVLYEKYVTLMEDEGVTFKKISEIVTEVLNDSMNFSSNHFIGFPDAGNNTAALIAGIVETTCQQNLLNADFCARAATFIEISTVQWLRELAGYKASRLKDVSELGGIATSGGTCSNMYGILMARKRAYPELFKKGPPKNYSPAIFVAGELTHYSISGAVGLLGLGQESIIKVKTKDFRYDLDDLKNKITQSKTNNQQIVCVVINAGDSRTLSIERIRETIDLVKSLAPKCWIHIDACHGFQLLFSDKQKFKLKGIEMADSISIDPHKVLNIPYCLSYFLFKDPSELDGFWISSKLIMKDPWALGRLSPNIGSKSWSSLKLYLLVKHLGRKKLAFVIDNRVKLAGYFFKQITLDKQFQAIIKKIGINGIPFVYIGGIDRTNIKMINEVNNRIYKRIINDGEFYVHGFPIADDCNLLDNGRNINYFVLRVAPGNPNQCTQDMDKLLHYLKKIGNQEEARLNCAIECEQ